MAKYNLPEIGGVDNAVYDTDLEWSEQPFETIVWGQLVMQTKRSSYTVEECMGGKKRYPYSEWIYEGFVLKVNVSFQYESMSPRYKSLSSFNAVLSKLDLSIQVGLNL